MRFYRLLLRFFPAEFRRRFGNDMSATFADRMRDARRRGRLATMGTWLRAVVDAVAHGLSERRTSRSETARTEAAMQTFLMDLSYGLRVMRHRPGFAAAAILTVGLGTGVNVAIFLGGSRGADRRSALSRSGAARPRRPSDPTHT
jgi:hypothetical protein